MTFQEEFLILLKARYSIIYVLTIEEDRLEYTIRNVTINKNYSNLYVWDFIDGYGLNHIKNEFGKRNPLEALEFVNRVNSRTPSIFILKDFRRFLKDLTISRKLKNTLQLLKVQPKTIVIVDSEIQIPSDLKDQITVLNFDLPKPLEIKKELIRLSKNLTIQGSLSPKILEKIIQACQGLSLEKIRSVVGKAIVIYKQMDENSIPIILEEKRQVISQTELLEFWSVNSTLKDVGGAYNLKRWLNARTEIFSQQALNYGLTTPKGLLLIGMQGSGKSLVAKAVSSEWKLPLLRLDVGRLFAGVVGESESRVREMIRITESLAPCVLWVDEIDKAFSDSEQNLDSGTTTRVLATFITWLAEKTLPVFVIATANDVYSLPIEILRKGRFDEIFFLGIPTVEERKLIYEIHLKRFRPDTWNKYDTRKLSKKARKFSGAEIEQTIIDAMYVAFSERREFTTNDILISIKETIPILEMDPLRTEVIQNWAISGKVRTA
uniref:hypothetical protein n=1 Tax=Analipus japonicus TaxID=31333 RepID=UPI002E79B9C8|nr:hypothetical protein V2471_pgp041 [Analipus japonicus]WAM61956.1 hypothetical protein [Analipus japonicus]